MFIKINSIVYTFTENCVNISKYIKKKKYITHGVNSYENPVLLDIDINYAMVIFIIKYITYFSNTCESKQPDTPINVRLHLSSIFKDEYILFADFIRPDRSSYFNIKSLHNFIRISKLLEMEILSDKLCAIVAYIIMSLDKKSLAQLTTQLSIQVKY